LWPGVHVVDASLGNLVAEIRSVLAEHAPGATIVRTVHGVGYAFAAETAEPVAPRPAGPAAARCWLVWKDRPIPLAAGDNVIGRDAGCAVWIDVEGVSRRHASLRVSHVEPPHATIVDLASTNGTFVEGREITDVEILGNGDRIRVGRATLTFRDSNGAGAKTRRVGPRGDRARGGFG
jgi:hypothetical protein